MSDIILADGYPGGIPDGGPGGGPPPTVVSASASDLGERALRRLNVAVVAIADRPALTVAISVREITGMALQNLGVIVTDADRPNPGVVITPATISERALQDLGITIPDADRPDAGASPTVTAIAEGALRKLGVPVAPADWPAVGVVDATLIAERALQQLGVIVTEVQRPVTGNGGTPATIASQALLLLGVIAADETPSADDLAYAMTQYNLVHFDLVSKGLISWDPNAAADGAVEDLILLVAMHCAAAFGKQVDPAQRPIIEARIGKVALILQAQALAEGRVEGEHDALVAQGFVFWDTRHIPLSVADDYTLLVAMGMGPMFGGKDDAQERAVISARIGHAALVLHGQIIAEEGVLAVHDSLVEQGYASWLSSAIPLSASEDYQFLVALSLAAAFGKQADPAQRPILEAHIARIALVLESQHLAEQRVLSVHDALSQRGLASWDVDHIPLAAADDYVALVAVQIAPVFDKPPVDPARVALVEARVGKLAFVIESEVLVEGMVAAVHDSLVAQGFIPWSLTTIPQCVADDYASLTTERAGPLVGRPADPKAVVLYESRIKRAVMVLRSPALATQAVMAVHSDLAARGKVRWSVFDIPDYVEFPYVVLAANILAPNFEQKPDLLAEQAARMSLDRLISLPSSGRPVVAAYF